jgi:cell division transport system permease protein
VIAWLRHHLYSLDRTTIRLMAAPVSTTLNVIVIGVALALPLAGYVLLQNLQSLANGFATQAQLTLFLDRSAGPEDVKSLEDRLGKEKNVMRLRFVPRATALAD